MPLSKVFVCGATGTQGRTVASALYQADPSISITSISRNVESDAAKAIQIAVPTLKLHAGSFDDKELLAEAMNGAEAVFMNFMPDRSNPAAEGNWASNVLEAAKTAGVKHVLYTSSPTVNNPERLKNWDPTHPMAAFLRSKREIELKVQSGGFRYWTLLRPAHFMSNFTLPLANMYTGLVTEGVWTNGYEPENLLPLVDPATIGKFTAGAFLNPEKFHEQEIDLADESLTVGQVLDKLSKAAGTELKAVYLTIEQVRERQKGDLAGMVLGSQVIIRTMDELVDIDAVRRFGVEPSTFDHFIEREKGSILATYGHLKK